MAVRSDDMYLSHYLTINSFVVVVLYENGLQNEQQIQ
jgi:hypothetical protein